MAIIGCWALVFLCIPSIIAFDEAPLTIAVFDIIDDVSNPGTERQYSIKGYETKRLLATVNWKHINTNITNIYQVRSLYDGHYDIYIFSPEMCEETFMLDIVAPGNLSINCVVPLSSSYSSSVADSSSFFLPGAAIPDDDKMCVYEQNGKKKTEIVASVLSHLGWLEVIVLYDHQTKNDVIALTAGLLGVTIVLYDIDIDDIGNDSDDFIDVIYDFYNRTDSKSRNFLLMCSQSCIDTVIQKASGFDKRFKGATALSVFSKWLVVNLEGKTELQDESSVDLDNVAVLNFPFNDERTSQKLFINRLKTVIHSTSMENDVNENMTSIFLEALEKELTTHTDCWRAELFTLLWKPEGRKFSPVGHVNYTGHVTMPSDVIIFPNTQFALNGRVLKITTLEWHPFNLKKPSVNGTLSYEGYCFDLLNILQHAINFSYTLREPEDGLWGDLKNGTWTGVVGQLYRREVDLHVGPLGISSARETAVDFTFPIYYFYSVVIFRLPDPNKDKWRKLIEPFTWQVHVCVVSAFCGTILFLYVIESVNPFYLCTKKRRPKFQNIVLYLYGALLAHGGPETPSSAAGRSLIAAWWIFCVITGATFSGTLIASLTVSKVNVPFKTLSQLASQDVYKWGTVDGTVWSLLMRESNVSDFQKLWAGIKRFNVTDPEVLDKDMEVHRRKVEEDNYGFIADHLSAELWREQSCNLAILDEVFYPLNVGFALQNHSPLLEYFNNEMMKIIESGVAQILRKDWWPNPNACTEATTSAKTIELADIQSAFYVMMIGIVLAALVIFIESCFVVSVDGVHFRFSSKMDARTKVINS